jgi:hypothetical protein
MTWSWDYHPDSEYVAAGAPIDFLAEVAKKADELVRMAEALYLDGTTFQGLGPSMEAVDIPGGMFHSSRRAAGHFSCGGNPGRRRVPQARPHRQPMKADVTRSLTTVTRTLKLRNS